MKFLFDLFPVILFFASFKIAALFPQAASSLAHLVDYQADPKQFPILLATAVVILATLAQIAWVKVRHGKVDHMLIASGVIVAVFGGATLLLHDEVFIKWKPTVLYWLFASVLSGAELFWHKNLIRSVMQEQIVLPEPVWRTLNHVWAAFFAALGVANLYVAFSFPTEIWVNFKLFGTMGLMLVFVLLQSLFLGRYITENE